MKINLSTGSLRGKPLPKIFETAKRIGFQGIELYLEYPYDPDRIDAEAIGKIKRKHALPVYSIHAPSYERYLKEYFFHPSFVQQTMSKTLDLAMQLEAQLVVIHPFPALWQKEKTMERFAELLSTLSADGIRWSVENLPRLSKRLPLEPHCLTNWQEFISFCGNLFTMTLDTTHALSCGKDPLTLFKQCEGIVRNIHFSDFRDGIQHLPLGEGKWDFRSFLKLIRESHYEGVVTLEIYPRRATAKNFLEKSMAAIQQVLKNRG